MVSYAFDKDVRNVDEVKLGLKYINSDRVQTDYHKWERPLAISANIDDPIKEGEKQHAPAVCV
jgi:hypothetical protein